MEPFEEARERALRGAKAGIKSSYGSEEFALIQAINAYRELTKSYNLAYERLSEWYGIYFPELRISNPKTLATLALVLNSKPISRDAVAAAVGEEGKADDIYAKANATMGREMGDEERGAVKKLAESNLAMDSALEALKGYVTAASKRLLPNTSYLTDETIAAELLSKAGSLEKLATMPASTIQLLGAEKALFKHIKFGSKPPKYGVLFKLPAVGTAPRHMRGRIARAYATKISIGLKGDVFSKRFIGEELKSSLDASLERIRSSPEPEPRQHTHEYQRRPMGGRRGFGGGRRPRGSERHGPPRRPGA